jgi:hypothetical protein
MKEKVINRIESFGVTIADSDWWVIDFIISKVENQIKNDCNLTTVPNELLEIAVDVVVGEFLKSKKSTGTLDSSAIVTTDAPIKSIKEGDTTITYAVSDGQQSNTGIDGLIASLINKQSEFIKFRRLRW